MYSKQVWHDRRHQIELFRNSDAEMIGTIVSFRKGICLVDPTSDILVALYQEAKIRRIGSINGVVLTSTSPERIRGLCTFLSYSRELRRKKRLDVRFLENPARASADFINSCCMQLMRRGSKFELDLAKVDERHPYLLGEGRIAPIEPYGDRSVRQTLEIRTRDRRILFVDDRLPRSADLSETSGKSPDVVVRTGSSPLRSTSPNGIVANLPEPRRPLVFS